MEVKNVSSRYRVWKYLIFAIFLVAVGILSGFFTMRLVMEGQEVIVPDFIGQRWEIASQKAQQLGLILRLDQEQFSDVVLKECIISQSPGPGDYVKKGRAIRVVLSKGFELTKVPDVRGQDMGRAEGILRTAGLILGQIARVHSNSVAKGMVIAQSPLSSTEVREGAPVNLLVSEGEREIWFSLPDFTGKKMREIAGYLQKLGLEVGHITYEVDPSRLRGVIVSQSPEPASRVKMGGVIDFKLCIPENNPQEWTPRYVTIRYDFPKKEGKKWVQVVVIDDRGYHQVCSEIRPLHLSLEMVVSVVGEAIAEIYVDNILVHEKIL